MQIIHKGDTALTKDEPEDMRCMWSEKWQKVWNQSNAPDISGVSTNNNHVLEHLSQWTGLPVLASVGKYWLEAMNVDLSNPQSLTNLTALLQTIWVIHSLLTYSPLKQNNMLCRREKRCRVSMEIWPNLWVNLSISTHQGGKTNFAFVDYVASPVPMSGITVAKI